jgi:hypothetical protein
VPSPWDDDDENGLVVCWFSHHRALPILNGQPSTLCPGWQARACELCAGTIWPIRTMSLIGAKLPFACQGR